MKCIGMSVAVGLWMVAASMAFAASSEQPIKDDDGHTMAVLVVCNDCSGAVDSAKCRDGADRGFVGDKVCGQCLVKANSDAHFDYPYDLHVTGKLVDGEGNPVKNRFAKLFLANGWSVKTRTGNDGSFRLMLGAIGDRKSQTPVVTDAGTRVDAQKAHPDSFALYLMPDKYQPCTEADAPPAAPKGTGKKKH